VGEGVGSLLGKFWKLERKEEFDIIVVGGEAIILIFIIG
jgi:hypothetical protein